MSERLSPPQTPKEPGSWRHSPSSLTWLGTLCERISTISSKSTDIIHAAMAIYQKSDIPDYQHHPRYANLRASLHGLRCFHDIDARTKPELEKDVLHYVEELMMGLRVLVCVRDMVAPTGLSVDGVRELRDIRAKARVVAREGFVVVGLMQKVVVRMEEREDGFVSGDGEMVLDLPGWSVNPAPL